MTDTELIELLAHPRLQSFVQRVAEQAALKAVATLPVGASNGDLTYADAAVFIGCPHTSIRTYVHRKELQRGAQKGTVTYSSCANFKRTYRPSVKP